MTRTLFALLFTGMSFAQPLPPTDLDRVQAGAAAPEFALPSSDGNAVKLASFRGKNVVLVFYRGYW